ncbi:hypothetical protein QLX08_007314 [Tetragonisca angustula]|uniref:Uncharacterized protein n=1 Tax=Tetragonisca angustula TaxID=166442 RepID=A0AAW0ZRW6_9HYME
MQSPGRIAWHYNEEVASAWEGAEEPYGRDLQKETRTKERIAALVHVNKRQAAYEKKTGITRGYYGKVKAPCFQQALLRDQVPFSNRDNAILYRTGC